MVTKIIQMDQNLKFSLDFKEVGIDFSVGYVMRDLWKKTDFSKTKKKEILLVAEPHCVVVLKIKGSFLVANFFTQ
ncbi:MAG: hypothetical protein DRJ07_09795 [Bacteroidetes bacterium]|nr:MAG: hypothetical protein DRJ07_09795 [Bacteroidota bacterium]